MTDKDKLISSEDGEGVAKDKKVPHRAPWYFGTAFLIVWILLFYSVVLPFYSRLPAVKTLEDDGKGEFIGDRAYETLTDLVKIAPRLAGSTNNEENAVAFLLNHIEDIRKVMLEEYFTLEVEVQQTTGSHSYSSLLETYIGVQNVVVKFASKNSTSESYLLVNSHFDTVPTSPGASDDGIMVAAMLEILHVMATTKRHYVHPVIFLFNGDEEMGMQASHGFMTQQKWGWNCKAFVNLEGSGGASREILFQTGPGHPWLAKYYKESIKHPFATTLAEEIFQAGLMSSDSDFRIFGQYGDLPGLDIGQLGNGYVHHSKYDRIESIPRGAIQNTGDNILSLVQTLANAPELEDTHPYRKGHAVFFDFLGLYFVSYTEDTGRQLNYGVAIATLVLVFVSLWRITAVSNLPESDVILRLVILLILQIVALVLALALPLMVASYFDSVGLSLTYFTSRWLIIGLYICPSLIGMSLPITLYFELQQKIKLPAVYHLQLALHSWAIILSVLLAGITAYGIRSVYILMIPLALYAISLAFNLLTTLHDRGYAWSGLLILGQIVPFLASSYVIYIFIDTLTPINGRSGSASNPDIMIAALAAIGTILCFGFLVPLVNMFRRPSSVVLVLVLLSGVAMFLASSTQLGFPYRAKTHSNRVMYQHVRRIFYEYDGIVSRDESGYLFNFQDRREDTAFKGVNLTGSIRMDKDCKQFSMCGVSLYDERWVKNRYQGMWLPREETIIPPIATKLELLSKTVLENNTTCRFKFRLTGPHYMNLFIQPYNDDLVTISKWSFNKRYLRFPPAPPLPYHIYMTFGKTNPTLDFKLDITKPNGDFNVPLFELGVSGFYIGDEGDEVSRKFAASFPEYAVLNSWPALYQRYIF